MRPLNYGSTITFRLPDDERALIEAAAEREDTSASAWVRKALRAVATAAPSAGSIMPTTATRASSAPALSEAA